MDFLPLQIAYGQLHAWMAGQGIKCITPAEKARREAESEELIQRAMKF